MRQAGILAAAALYAVENNRARLAQDHANARALGEGIAGIAGLSVDLAALETNLLFFEVDPKLGTAAEFCARLRERGVWMLPTGPRTVRAVTHLDVDEGMIGRAIEAVGESNTRRQG